MASTVLTYILIGQYVVLAVMHVLEQDGARALYWIGAAILTVSVVGMK